MADTPNAPPYARFTQLGDGLTAELISNQVQFFYNPTDGSARAIFNGMPYLAINGGYRALSAANDTLNVDFVDKIAVCYAAGTDINDPVTGKPLSDVSVAGVMTLIKIAYDKEVNARETARLAKVAAAEAAAEAAAALATAIQEMTTAADSPTESGTVVAFTANTVDAPTVIFTDTTTPAAGLSVSKRSWLFGDGMGHSMEEQPVYTYSKADRYTVTLTVTLSDGTTVRTSQLVGTPAPLSLVVETPPESATM